MSAGAFLTLFAGSGKRRLEDGWELRVVPAFAVLQARREALERSAQDDGALGLWMNACVLARTLYKDGQRAFSDGEAVMQAASAEKIERWMQAYAALCREDNPACSEENARLAAQALGQEDYERLKWRVLKRFRRSAVGDARAAHDGPGSISTARRSCCSTSRRNSRQCAPRAARKQNGGFARCAASRFRRKTQDLMKDGLRS